jgi:hypothetical protein
VCDGERDESPVIIIIIIIAARPSYSFFSLEAVSGLNESIKRGVGKCAVWREEAMEIYFH